MGEKNKKQEKLNLEYDNFGVAQLAIANIPYRIVLEYLPLQSRIRATVFKTVDGIETFDYQTSWYPRYAQVEQELVSWRQSKNDDTDVQPGSVSPTLGETAG